MRQQLLCRLVGSLGLFLLMSPTPKAQESPKGERGRQWTMTVVSPGLTESGLEEPGGLIPPMRVSMDFQDANLKDVLKTFSQQTGINVIASEEVGDRMVTLYLEEVTLLDALDQILAATGLTYERPLGSQIYIVRSKPKAEAPEVVAHTKVYKLRFARVSASKLATAAASLGPTGAGLAIGGVGGAGGGGVTTGGIGIDQIIAQLLTSRGRVMVDGRTNSLVVTDIPENFARIEATLNALDVKTPQVMIEAEILETNLSKLKDLGIEWGSDAEGTHVAFTGASRTTRFPFLDPFHGERTTAGKITVGTLDFSTLKAALQALEQDASTKILARPKVLTLDNETAIIKLSSEQAVAVQSVSIPQTNQVISTPERMTTGVILSVTPQVNDDGFVTMLVEPSVTKVVTSEVSKSVVDPKTRSARAMVRIRQGETLVLGGLIDRSEKESVQRVPLLSSIPLLGAAFKNTEVNDAASELIVFVTPRIMAEPLKGQVAAVGEAPFAEREKEASPARYETMEETLNRLERPSM